MIIIPMHMSVEYEVCVKVRSHMSTRNSPTSDILVAALSALT